MKRTVVRVTVKLEIVERRSLLSLRNTGNVWVKEDDCPFKTTDIRVLEE